LSAMSFFERRFAPLGNSFMGEDLPSTHGVRSRSVPAYARLLVAAHEASRPDLSAAVSVAAPAATAEAAVGEVDVEQCESGGDRDRQVVWPDTDSEAEWEAPRPRRAKTYDIAMCQKLAGSLGNQADAGSTLSTTDTLASHARIELDAPDYSPSAFCDLDAESRQPSSSPQRSQYSVGQPFLLPSLCQRSRQCAQTVFNCADGSEGGLRERRAGDRSSQVIELFPYLGKASDDLGDSCASSNSSQSACSSATQLLSGSANSCSHQDSIGEASSSSSSCVQTRSSAPMLVVTCIPLEMATPQPLLASCPAAAPTAAGLHADHVSDTEGRGVSTVMIRNLPSKLSQQQLLEELNRCGFAACYDFCYMPCSFQTEENQGIAFVNFTSPAKASELLRSWHRARPLGSTTSPELSVAPAAVQGLEANLRALGSRLRRIRNPKLRPFVCSAALSPSKPQPQQPSQEQLRPGQSALPVTPGLQARPTGPRQQEQQNHHQRQRPRRLALAAATATAAGGPQALERRRTTPAGERVIVA